MKIFIAHQIRRVAIGVLSASWWSGREVGLIRSLINYQFDRNGLYHLLYHCCVWVSVCISVRISLDGSNREFLCPNLYENLGARMKNKLRKPFQMLSTVPLTARCKERRIFEMSSLHTNYVVLIGAIDFIDSRAALCDLWQRILKYTNNKTSSRTSRIFNRTPTPETLDQKLLEPPTLWSRDSHSDWQRQFD